MVKRIYKSINSTRYSSSQLQLPKFHNLNCDIIPSIVEYGVITSFSTETYETLHKEWVKNPYRMSNKRDAILQMLRTVSKKFNCCYVALLYK